MMTKALLLKDLPGLGPKSQQMLVEAGIDSVETLRTLGPISAFMQVKRYQAQLDQPKNASLNLLYALVGAVEGEHWLSVAQEQKAQLIMQLEGYAELEKLFQQEGKKL